MVHAIALIFGAACLCHGVGGLDSRLWLAQRADSDSDGADALPSQPEEATRLMNLIGGLKEVAEAAKDQAAEKASTAAKQTPMGQEGNQSDPRKKAAEDFFAWVKKVREITAQTKAEAEAKAAKLKALSSVESPAKEAADPGSPSAGDAKKSLGDFVSWAKQQAEKNAAMKAEADRRFKAEHEQVEAEAAEHAAKAASSAPAATSDSRMKALGDFVTWVKDATARKAEAAKPVEQPAVGAASTPAAASDPKKKPLEDFVSWVKQQAQKGAAMKEEANQRFAAAQQQASTQPAASSAAIDPKRQAFEAFVAWAKQESDKNAAMKAEAVREIEIAKHRGVVQQGAVPAAPQATAAPAMKAEAVRQIQAAKHSGEVQPEAAVPAAAVPAAAATPAAPKATEAPAEADERTVETQPNLLDQLAPWVKDLQNWQAEVAHMKQPSSALAAASFTPAVGKAVPPAEENFWGWMNQQKELAAQNAAAKVEAEAQYQQLEQQRGTKGAVAATEAPVVAADKIVSPVGDLQAWVKQEQETAARAAAKAAHEAATGTAKTAMGGLIEWLKTQGELAAQRAAAAQAPAEQDSATKAAEFKTADITKAWTELMDKAKSTAAKTAQEELAKQSAELQTPPSKDTVDASIVEAEKRLEAADASRQVHPVLADAAEKAAKQASERALEDLLKWAEDGKPAQPSPVGHAGATELLKAAEEAKQPTQLLKGTQEVNQTQEVNLTQEVNQTQDPVHESWRGVFDAWASANAAWDKTRAADKAEQATRDTAARAAWVVDLGHNISKAISRARKPGATKVAMGALQDAGNKAKESLYDSYVAGNDASDVKDLFAKAVQAALRTTGSDRTSAAQAVARTYGAVERAGKDALMAARHTNDALQAVARATAEVGWRAVSEILAKELTLVATVAEKVSVAKDLEKISALAEGLAQAKKVAQIAWFKGLGDGLRRPASAEALGKVVVASNSVANVSFAWIKAVSKAMQTTEAQEAVTKAASMATKAASAAALRASDRKAKSVQQSLFRVVKDGKKPWLKAGAEVTTVSNWNKENGFSGDAVATVGQFDKLYAMGHINAKPNPTHMKIEALGKAGVPAGPKADLNVKASIGKAPGVSTDVEGSFYQSVPHTEPVAAKGTLHAQPVEDAYVINGASVIASKSRSLTDTLSAVAANDGRGAGKARVWVRTPEFKDPVEATLNFVQPFRTKQ